MRTTGVGLTLGARGVASGGQTDRGREGLSALWFEELKARVPTN